MSNQNSDFNPAVKYVSVPQPDIQIQETTQSSFTLQNSHPVKIPLHERNDFKHILKKLPDPKEEES